MNPALCALARHAAKQAVLDYARGEAIDQRQVKGLTAKQIAALTEQWLKDHPAIRDEVKARYADILK